MINKEIKKYIETMIIPKYADFDKGHNLEHVKTVIEESLNVAKNCGVNLDYVYVIAAYHDLGLSEGREFHHIASGKILEADITLRQWFSLDEIKLMKEAVEDHRASSKNPPRSIYGKIVAEADRDINPLKIIKRTIQYSIAHSPSPDKEHHWNNLLNHMAEKYAEGGYMKLWFENSKNSERLKELRKIIANQNNLRNIFLKLYDEELIIQK